MTIAVRPASRRRMPGLDPALGVQVDVRGRLVEDEDPRVGDQRAGERDELALAGRELDAALADLACRARRAARATKSSAPTPRSARPHVLLVGVRRARTRCSRAIVPLNRNASCGTIPICERSDAVRTSRRSTPSTRTRPTVGS